jgi:CBS domain-containing protein
VSGPVSGASRIATIGRRVRDVRHGPRQLRRANLELAAPGTGPALPEKGKAMAHKTVADVMTPVERVVAVRPETSYKRIATLLAEHRVSALPVLDADGRVIGVVSEADLLTKESCSQDAPSSRPAVSLGEHHARLKARAAVAAELMSAPAITVAAGMSVAEGARRMERARVKRLPVVDAQGHLAGIVSRADILRIFLRPDAELREDVRELLVDQFWIEPTGWSVYVEDGVVRLAGRMETRSTVQIAANAVHRIDGVVSVENELTYVFDDTKLRPAPDAPYGSVFDPRHVQHGQ